MKKTMIFIFSAAVIFVRADYIIVKGDNLWDLALKYYGNAFEWRYIWEHNRYIADPHWIYPGDILILPGISSMRNQNTMESRNITLSTQSDSDGDFIVSVNNGALNNNGMMRIEPSQTFVQLRDQTQRFPTQSQRFFADKYKYFFSIEALQQAPFIYDEKVGGSIDIFAFGKVADNNRQVLLQNQNILVKTDTEYFKVGMQVDFYEARHDLKNKNGIVSEPVATGTVKAIDKDYTTVFVDRVWGVLKDGAKIAPVRKYRNLGDNLTYRNLSDSLEVQIIARMSPDFSMKPSEILFINKGSQNGIEIGDHIVIYESARRGSKRKYAEQPTADGLVIAVEKNTATVKTTSVWELSMSNTFVGIRCGKTVAK